MQFNDVNNKEGLHSPGSQQCRHIFLHTFRRHFSCIFVVAAQCPGSSLPSPFLPSFYCFNSVTGACSSYCVGAHGWVARICQPRGQSSSRSWLPIYSGSSWMSQAPNLHFSDAVINMKLNTNTIISVYNSIIIWTQVQSMNFTSPLSGSCWVHFKSDCLVWSQGYGPILGEENVQVICSLINNLKNASSL